MGAPPKVGKPLTWNELADLYDKAHRAGSIPARTLSMNFVFSWAERQKNKFYVDPVEGSIHLIEQEGQDGKG